MAYQRRYFPALTITTISYGEKSVTADKLADSAVITPKVADDAITSEKIVDGQVKSEDIGTGQVKTVDIASKAVTQSKLADGAVGTYQLGFESISGSKIKPATITADKMSEDVPTRPLTPGVATAEIQNGQVTVDKLAADAVITVKIEDDAITAPKIASGAVGNTEIAANAVHGVEILNGAVSEDKLGVKAVTNAKIDDGAVDTLQLATDAVETEKILDANVTHDKLAADAVETDNIKDLNVTEPKLANDVLSQRLIEASLVDKSFFFDEFLGTVLGDAWTATGDIGGSVVLTGDHVKIKTSAIQFDDYRIDWNGVRGETFPNALPRFLAKCKRDSITFVTNNIGLWKDVDNGAYFQAHEVAGGAVNWLAKTIRGGVLTSNDTGVLFKTTEQELKIVYEAVDSVYFYIDGVEVAHHTVAAGIPITDFEVRCEVITQSAATRELWLDYVLLTQDRVRP